MQRWEGGCCDAFFVTLLWPGGARTRELTEGRLEYGSGDIALSLPAPHGVCVWWLGSLFWRLFRTTPRRTVLDGVRSSSSCYSGLQLLQWAPVVTVGVRDEIRAWQSPPPRLSPRGTAIKLLVSPRICPLSSFRSHPPDPSCTVSRFMIYHPGPPHPLPPHPLGPPIAATPVRVHWSRRSRVFYPCTPTLLPPLLVCTADPLVGPL